VVVSENMGLFSGCRSCTIESAISSSNAAVADHLPEKLREIPKCAARLEPGHAAQRMLLREAATTAARARVLRRQSARPLPMTMVS
jgi:hypothetical protein